MSDPTCPRETEAVASVGTGEPAADLAAHLAGCSRCREVVTVSTWLRDLARETRVGPLPHPDRVWRRARVERRLAERRAMIERAGRPIRWFERGAAALALAAAGLLSLQGAEAADALARFSDPALLGALAALLLGAAAAAAHRTVRDG